MIRGPESIQPGEIYEDRECIVCGYTIPAGFRHFLRPGNVGVTICELQNMRAMAMHGGCAVCDQAAYQTCHSEDNGRTFGEWGLPHHFEAALDDDHKAVYKSLPLVRAITEYLDRVTP